MIQCYRSQDRSFVFLKKEHCSFLLSLKHSVIWLAGMFTALVPGFKLEVHSLNCHSAHLHSLKPALNSVRSQLYKFY